jgi:hypothetical protein
VSLEPIKMHELLAMPPHPNHDETTAMDRLKTKKEVTISALRAIGKVTNTEGALSVTNMSHSPPIKTHTCANKSIAGHGRTHLSHGIQFHLQPHQQRRW